jgi:hypothetical protein
MNLLTHKTTKPVEILNSCSCIALLQLILEISTAVISVSFVARFVSVTDKHFLYPEILLAISLLSYVVLPCQDTHF